MVVVSLICFPALKDLCPLLCNVLCLGCCFSHIFISASPPPCRPLFQARACGSGPCYFIWSRSRSLYIHSFQFPAKHFPPSDAFLSHYTCY